MSAAVAAPRRARAWRATPGAACSATGRSSRSRPAGASSSSSSELVRPGIVGAEWAGVILRAAVPLAILAGCQTLTMLTGGIDLSVGAVASMAGLRRRPRWSTARASRSALVVALVAAALAGLVTGIGVGVFRVHPLIMTLGMSLVVLGPGQRLAAPDGPDRRRASRPSCAARVRTVPRGPAVQPRASSCRSPPLILLGLRRTGLRPAAVRDRRQPDRRAPVGRPRPGRS